jgi:uncharacterized membrane protein
MLIDKLFRKGPGDRSVKRHLAKTVTWRIVGTVDTIVLSWIITGNPMSALKIGGLEVCTKMILYFIHERVWFKLNFGLEHRSSSSQAVDGSTK